MPISARRKQYNRPVRSGLKLRGRVHKVIVRTAATVQTWLERERLRSGSPRPRRNDATDGGVFTVTEGERGGSGAGAGAQSGAGGEVGGSRRVNTVKGRA